MWEEINQKQNEDKMLQLQYYARKLYDTSNILFIAKIIILMINSVWAIVKINGWVVALFTIIYLGLQHCEYICIKNAASAREIFDAILFDFNIPKENQKIKENAYKLCRRKNKEFEEQKNNTGEDKPAGIKNWYMKSNANTKNEIIFSCQVENTKWDEEITKINSIIWWSFIGILFVIYIIIRYKDSVLDFILGLVVFLELIIEIIRVALEYKKYNKNLIKRKFQIEKIKPERIKRDELILLQDLIRERRNLMLVPFNSIHKFITIKMHDLLKNT